MNEELAAGRTRQRGLALMLMLLGLLTASAWLTLELGENLHWQRQQREQASLLEARDLLIARSLATWDAEQARSESRPGALRCTDRDHDGSADVVGCSSRILGRFPWRSLRAGKAFRDGQGQWLWYAVNPALADWGRVSHFVNSESATISGHPALTLDGVEVAAILIAPGEALPTQRARTPGQTDPAMFLEAANADGDHAFVSRAAGAFNDRVLALAYEDFLPAIERLVLHAARDALLAYRDAPGCGRLPWPAPFDPSLAQADSEPGRTGGLLPTGVALTDSAASACAATIALPAWLTNNQWQRLLFYARAEDGVRCDQPGGSGECLQLATTTTLDTDVHALLIVSGRPLRIAGRSQRRRSNQLQEYFEGANADGDTRYESRQPASAFNDQILIVSSATGSP